MKYFILVLSILIANSSFAEDFFWHSINEKPSIYKMEINQVNYKIFAKNDKSNNNNAKKIFITVLDKDSELKEFIKNSRFHSVIDGIEYNGYIFLERKGVSDVNIKKMIKLISLKMPNNKYTLGFGGYKDSTNLITSALCDVEGKYSYNLLINVGGSINGCDNVIFENIFEFNSNKSNYQSIKNDFERKITKRVSKDCTPKTSGSKIWRSGKMIQFEVSCGKRREIVTNYNVEKENFHWPSRYWFFITEGDDIMPNYNMDRLIMEKM
jgi:hypothetical protein